MLCSAVRQNRARTAAVVHMTSAAAAARASVLSVQGLPSKDLKAECNRHDWVNSVVGLLVSFLIVIHVFLGNRILKCSALVFIGHAHGLQDTNQQIPKCTRQYLSCSSPSVPGAIPF